MTKINLRAYNRQIGDLITRGAYDEAIAHCRHILGIFPKHVATYRLLGSAYLEVQRYQEAADVFQRVLAAVPDDFAAHFALSKVREASGDRKAALWHMERAFEVQPSSPAVQDELRRLYEAAEGLAPPRLRLTRGALARMYLKNGLYAQAVAELRSALADEPQRADLMVLLAEALFQDGKPVEAASTAASLLRKLPYCLQANRLMARVLTATGREEEAKPYLQRLAAVDPYEAYCSPSRPTADKVPDDAVQLEALEWTPEMAAETGWEASPSAPAEPPSPPETETDAVPSWFHEPEGLETPEEEGEAPALEAAELPDWLQAMAPQTEAEAETSLPETEVPDAPIDEEFAALLGGEALAPAPEASAGEELPLPDWLSGVGEEAPLAGEPLAPAEAAPTAEEAAPAAEEAEAPEWLAGLGEGEGETAAAAGEEESLPEWLAETPSEAAPAAEEAAPAAEEAEAPVAEDEALAWLESLAAKQGAEEEELLTTPEARAETPPEWVAEMAAGSGAETEAAPAAEAPAAEEAEAPEWLAGLGEGEGEGEGETAAAAGEEENLPEWLAETPAEAAPAAEEAAPAAEEAEAPVAEDEALAWLESLAAKQGAEEEELLTTPEARAETPPEWVAEMAAGSSAETEAAPAAEEAAPASETPVAEETEAPVAEDEALAWLESLAAKQGAEEEELLTTPEARAETPPEWVAEMAAGSGAEAEAAPAAEEAAPAAEEAEVPEWLAGLGEGEGETAAAAGEEKSLPEWLTETPAEAAPAAEEAAPAAEEAEAPVAEDEALAWLESLAAKQGAEEEELLTTPEARAETPPEWVAEMAAGGGAEAEAAPTAEEAAPASETPGAEEAEVPEWLTETPAEAAPAAKEAAPAAEAPAPQPKASGEWLPETSLPQTPPLMDESSRAAPAAPRKQASPKRPRGADRLEAARAALASGEVPAALKHYAYLIRRRASLDEVIADLEAALVRYPVHVDLLQALGDAYMRADRLREALEAYNKAEALLR